MERQIRRLAIGFLILFGAIAVNLNYIQVVAADRIANNNANRRLLIQEYEVDRGAIVAADHRTVLADSEATGGDLKYQRSYPEDPDLGYGHITGYHSFIFGRTELEQTYNNYLSARAAELFPQQLIDEILGRDEQGAGLVLTIDPELQAIAAEGLAGQQGAVAAIDPRSGEVLALVSNPTYDPNPLASHEPDEVRRAYRQLRPQEPDSPLVSRATDTFFPPGSSFKVVTAAAALESGRGPDFALPNPSSLDLPQTTANLDNFGGSQCSGGSQIDMASALQQSCNVYFAQLAMEVGADTFVEQAHRFGFSEDIPFDIPFVEGEIPDPDAFDLDIPALAQSGIGQRDVRTNVLHMALIAGSIGNDGVMMVPRLVSEIRDPDARILRSFEPEEFGTPMRPENARTLTEMMVSVVDAGTGTAAQIPGVRVAGKTGTAQTAEGQAPHAWFIAFAPAEAPEVAVAVVVLNGGDLGNEITGGQASAPIAQAVMEEALRG
ncbi:MAG: peptidoglycan D,D-transpeptidase FtsI family protein [Actinomycetota bacterium]